MFVFDHRMIMHFNRTDYFRPIQVPKHISQKLLGLSRTPPPPLLCAPCFYVLVKTFQRCYPNSVGIGIAPRPTLTLFRALLIFCVFNKELTQAMFFTTRAPATEVNRLMACDGVSCCCLKSQPPFLPLPRKA